MEGLYRVGEGVSKQEGRMLHSEEQATRQGGAMMATTMTTPAQTTLAEVLKQAQLLTPADQARLVSLLSANLVDALTNLPNERSRGLDPRALLDLIREDFRRQGPVSPSMSEDLQASREERERSVHS